MTNEELEKIKNEYEKLKHFKKNMNLLYERKKELEKSEQVIEYIRIMKLISPSSSNPRDDFMHESSIKTLTRILRQEQITSTNNLYFFVSSGEYNIYRNIEDEYNFVQISKEDNDEFIKNNIIFYNTFPHIEDMDYYYEIRNMFFQFAIEYGQEKALEKVLNLRKK